MTTEHILHEPARDIARSTTSLDGSGETVKPVHRPQSVIPKDIQELYGKPLTIHGENAALYNRLLEDLALAIRPKDVMDWLWIKDVADYAWEILRLQRLKGAVVDLNRKGAVSQVLRKVLHPNKHDGHLDRLASAWFTDAKIREEGNKILKTLDLSEDCIVAQAVSNSSSELTTINGLLGSATSRRDAALREIDRRRESVFEPRRAAETIDGKTGEPVSLVPEAGSGNAQ